ncbi:DnaB-like helicase C-terminal domain-containing protein [Candidatus Margulisiibacteriota bacterium]
MIKPEQLRNLDARKVYEWIIDYCKKYDDFPTKELIKETFDYVTIEDEGIAPQYFIDKIYERDNKTVIANTIRNIGIKISSGDEWDAEEISNEVLSELSNVKSSVISCPRIQDTESKEEIERYLQIASNEHYDALQFGIPTLDSLGRGILKGNLVCIQARTGIGKTFFATYLTSRWWREGKKILFISLEMSESEMKDRLYPFSCGIRYEKLTIGQLNDDEIFKYNHFLDDVRHKYPDFYIPCPASCTIDTVKSLILDTNPDVVVVDFIQRMKSTNSNDARHIELESVANEFKNMAKEKEIVILVLSQTNRIGVNKKPTSENLAQADAIGWASDILISLYKNEEDKLQGIMNIDIIKYRNFKEGFARVKWDIGNSIIEESSNQARRRRA